MIHPHDGPAFAFLFCVKKTEAMIRHTIALVCLSAAPVLGQVRERYLLGGLGTSLYTMQDPTVSPLTYRGGPFALAFGYEKQKTRAFSRLSLGGDLGALRAANATPQRPMRSSTYRIDLTYQHLRWLSAPAARWRWFVGGAYRWHNSVRITPQNDTGMISFFIANSLGAAGGVEHAVEAFGKTLRLNVLAEVPLLSHVVRPSYLNLYNYLDPENDFVGERFRAGRLATVNRFPAVISNTALTYPIGGENQLRLAYEWAFYHYHLPFRANVGRHTVLLSLLVRI